jgi:cholesterol transport system auxiliary component
MSMLLLVCVTAGCASLPTPPARPAVYDFGPGGAAPSAPNPHSLPAIALMQVEAPPALDGAAVLYRLAYADAQQLRPYMQARWSMPPAHLVRQRLVESLGSRRAVFNAGDGEAPFALRVELLEFSHVFASAVASSGLVRLRATLTEPAAGTNRLVAQKVFVVQRPAASPDAAGGVRALAAATDGAIEEIDAWLRQLPAK